MCPVQIQLGESKKALILRIAVMCGMILSGWVMLAVAKAGSIILLYLGTPDLLYLGPPVVAGFYAGATSRTYLSALFAWLAASGAVVLMLPAYLSLWYPGFGGMPLWQVVGSMTRHFAIYFGGIIGAGAVSGLAVSRLWRKAGWRGFGIRERALRVQRAVKARAVVVSVVLVIVTLGILAGLLYVRWRDRDFDGLTNREEAIMGTDPKNPNTDRDRLVDGRDPDPLRYDYPDLDLELQNWVDTTDCSRLAVLVNETPAGQVPENIPRFTGTYELVVSNRGTDLAKHGVVTVRGVIQRWRDTPMSSSIHTITVCTMDFTFGRIDPNQSITFEGSVDVDLTDSWEQLREAVEGQEPSLRWSVREPALNLALGSGRLEAVNPEWDSHLHDQASGVLLTLALGPLWWAATVTTVAVMCGSLKHLGWSRRKKLKK